MNRAALQTGVAAAAPDPRRAAPVEILAGGAPADHARVWEVAAGAAADPLLFATSAWSGAWWSQFGGGKQLWLVRGGTAAAPALLPLVHTTMGRNPALSFHYDVQPEDRAFLRRRPPMAWLPVRQLSPLLNLQSGAMRGGWLARAGAEEDFFGAVFPVLAARADWDLLVLPAVDAAATPWLASLARDAGLGVRVEPAARRLYHLDVPASWAAYLAARRRHFRKRFAEAHKRLAALGDIRTHTVTAPDALPAALDTLFAIAAASWKCAGRDDQAVHLPPTPAAEAFNRDLARRLAPAGRCQVHLVEVGGRAVAGLLSYTAGDTAYALQTYYHPDAAAGSPGRFVFPPLIDWCAAHGIRRLDFNGNSHIVQTLTQAHTVYDRLLIFARGPRARLLQGLAGAVRALRRRPAAAAAVAEPEPEHG